jgi:hypothetical protein
VGGFTNQDILDYHEGFSREEIGWKELERICADLEQEDGLEEDGLAVSWLMEAKEELKRVPKANRKGQSRLQREWLMGHRSLCGFSLDDTRPELTYCEDYNT